MNMQDVKSFDLDDIDETLTRVIVHGEKTHLLFPYINGIGAQPQYNSIGVVIAGTVATLQDFHALTLKAKGAGEGAVWRIVFNTPWLIRPSEDDGSSERKRRS